MKGKLIVPQMVAGSLVTIIVWCARQYGQVEIPGEVGAAAAGILAVLVSIITPDSMESNE